MEDTCPIIQSIAVISFVSSLIIHATVSLFISRFIREDYLKEVEGSKLKTYLLDIPEFLPSRSFKKFGIHLKWLAVIATTVGIISAIYIGHLVANDMLCVATSYHAEW